MNAGPVLVAWAVVVAVVVFPGRPARRAGPGPRRLRPAGALWLDERLRRADLSVDAGRGVAVWGAIAGVGAGAGLLVGGSAGMVVGALGASVAVPAWVVSRGDRRRRAVVGGLPELLELLARSLRGGADLHRAVHDVADPGSPTGATLVPVLDRIDTGARLGEALDRWVVDLDHPDAAVVRAVLRLGDATGAATAAALERAAATLHDRAAVRAELGALTTQTRVSALVISLAPLGFLVVVAVADPATAGVLFTTGWGRVCLVVGLALDTVGVLWMRRITAGVAP